MYVLKKAMKRQLTVAEKNQILEHLVKNPKEDVLITIEKFETVFDTPITISCVTQIIVEDELMKRGAGCQKI